MVDLGLDFFAGFFEVLLVMDFFVTAISVSPCKFGFEISYANSCAFYVPNSEPEEKSCIWLMMHGLAQLRGVYGRQAFSEKVKKLNGRR